MDAMMVTTALVVGFIFLLALWLQLRKPSVRLPPGPRPLPVLGNALLLRKYPGFVELVHDLTNQYGPIVTLWMFQTRYVIISNPEVIQEAMIKQGNLFDARRFIKSTIISNNNHRTISGSVGERHRFLRRLLVSEILANKRQTEFRPIREREVGILIENLKKQLEHGDSDDSKDRRATVKNIRALIRLTTCNLMMGALIGRRLTLEEYEELDDVMVKRFALGGGKVSDDLPVLALLPDKKHVQQQRQILKIMTDTFQPFIEERRQVLKKGTRTSRAGIVDTLLEFQSGKTQNNPNTDIFDTDIVGVCMDILNAGLDTTALNLEYCLGNLMNHPEVQEKLAHEISDVVGSAQRVVDEDDIPKLPYLQAVVKEALRRHAPLRLSPSRTNSSPAKVAGYDIPANTVVLQNLEAVGLSSQIWKDPLEFRPERHLNVTVDVTGSTDVKLIPFGVGLRICPAVNVAFLHAELILARLIQEFHWNPATPGQMVDLTPDVGFINPLKHPLAPCLSERA